MRLDAHRWPANAGPPAGDSRDDRHPLPVGAMRVLIGVEALNSLLLVGWSAAYAYIEMERYSLLGVQGSAPRIMRPSRPRMSQAFAVRSEAVGEVDPLGAGPNAGDGAPA